MQRRLLLSLLPGAALSAAATPGSCSPPLQSSCSDTDHTAWVAQQLSAMRSVTPGMTRKDLLKVFTTEGGVSTALQRTFVSKQCPYFKVDVQFEAVGRSERDKDGRETSVEGEQDRIVSISEPYLQFMVTD